MKKILLFLSFLLMSIGVWGDETLSLDKTYWGTSSYTTSTGTKTTSSSTSIGLSWTDTYQHDGGIQMKKNSGEVHSTSYPSTNNVIKSITVSVKTNTANVYGSINGSSWTSITSGSNVSSSGYKYFKVTSTGSYCVLNSITVVYTATSAVYHTLSSAVSPTGSGSVSLSSTNVAEGTTATATAIPEDGYTFSSWSISGTGASLSSTTDNPTTITMGTANATISATFATMPELEFVLHMGKVIDGDYLIYYDGRAMNNVIESNRLQYENVTPIDYKITTDKKSIIWNISKIPETNYFTIKSIKNGKYVSFNNNNGQVKLVDEVTNDTAKWVIDVINGKTYDFINLAQANDSRNKLRNNGTYGFARYADGTGGSLTLYKDGEGNHTVQWFVNDELHGIQSISDGFPIINMPTVNTSEYCGDIVDGWLSRSYFSNSPPIVEASPTINQDTSFYAVFASYGTKSDTTYIKVNPEELVSGDSVIIVCRNNKGYYAMSNNNGTTAAPSAIDVNPENNFLFTAPLNKLWGVSIDNNGYIFHTGDSWLYSTNDNNGMRVGSNTNNVFSIDTESGYLFNNATSRYVGVYNSSDWRGYTSINSNITNQTFHFYKKIPNLTDFHTSCIRIFNDDENDGLWTTDGNWTNGKQPTLKYTAQINDPVEVDAVHASAKNIVINKCTGAGKITIKASNGLEVDSVIEVYDGEYRATAQTDLVLESSASGNASLIFNNSNGNSATVHLYSKATYPGLDGSNADWQYIGTTMTELNALYNYYGSWLYEWVGGDEKWHAVPNGGMMEAWKGYCITQSDATYHETSGQLVPTTTKTLDIYAPYTVVANSWTAPIHIGAFRDADFNSITDRRIYLFNTGFDPGGDSAVYTTRHNSPGTYVVIPIHAAPYLDKDSLIPSQQGFFVKTSTNGHLILDYDRIVRTGGSGDIVAGPLRAPRRADADDKPNVLKIYANGSRFSDRLTILEREDFTTSLDNGWDGDKMGFSNLAPSIYVINEDGSYDEVSAIPDYEGTLIGFKAGTDIAYSITFDYDGDETIYLNDMLTQTSTLIDNESKYVFTSDGYEEVRFVISATPYAGVATDIDKLTEQSNTTHKFLYNGNLYILKNNCIFNVVGSLVK